MTNTFIIYLVVMNIIGFALMGIDKMRAKRQEWRIPEKLIFLCALLGGSFGAAVGMNIFRHKTKHWYFRYGLPAILMVQVMIAGYLF